MVAAGIFGPEDRVELLDGEIIEMSPEKSRHAAAVDLALEALRRAFGDGFVVRVQHPLALDDTSEPEPDLAVVPGRARDYADAHPRGAALVVEVADSSLDYDRTRKTAAYARAGIREYWIVNLVDRRLEVFRDPRAAAYESRLTFGAGDTLAPLAAAGSQVMVSDLLP
jgi:Uma2 family endonuclease